MPEQGAYMVMLQVITEPLSSMNFDNLHGMTGIEFLWPKYGGKQHEAQDMCAHNQDQETME